MRKIALFLAIAILLCGCFSFCSCEMLNENYLIANFLVKLQSAESMQMTLTMGEASLVTKIDGNLTHSTAFLLLPEMYTETTDGKTTIYSKKPDGTWEKSEQKLGDYINFNDKLYSEIATLFNPDNYVKAESKNNVFNLKEGVTFEGAENIVITINDDSCVIDIPVEYTGIKVIAKVVINNFNKVNVTLPNV